MVLRIKWNWLQAARVLGLGCCVVMCGCNHDGRQSLEGTVTLDGQPLPTGDITFFPVPGTPGPTAGGKIVEGRFSISAEGGTMAGTFRVQITARRKTGKQVFDPTAQMMDPNAKNGMIDQYEQYLPSRYNQQSELTADVIQGGKNVFDFPLRLK